MQYTLHQLPGTTGFVISQRITSASVATLVAEVVVSSHGSGYSLLRMDASGLLAEHLPSPLSAWSFYVLWAKHCNPTITGVPIS